MAKLDPLTTITTGFSSTAQLNDNFTKIAAAFENTLSRDGSTPNFMDAVLDLNGFRIINLGDAINPGDAVSLNYLTLNFVEPNRFLTVDGDSGSTTADSPTDTLTIAGSGGIATSVAGDTVTIDGSAIVGGGDPDQNLWETITADTGSEIATGITETLTVSGAGGIATDMTGTTLTIDGSAIVGGGDPDQNLWESIQADAGANSTAAGITDTLQILGGVGISTASDGVNQITITNTAFPIGATQFTVDHLSDPADFTAGVSNSVTLSTAPFSTDSLIVFFKGVSQFVPEIASLIGTTLTFTNTIPAGVTEIQVYILDDPIYGAFSLPADIPLVSGGAIGPTAHSLSSAPTHYELSLVCLTAEAGYGIGDVVPISMGVDSNNRGVQLENDATNIIGVFGSDVNAFALADATTGTYTALTNANWELRIRAIS